MRIRAADHLRLEQFPHVRRLYTARAVCVSLLKISCFPRWKRKEPAMKVLITTDWYRPVINGVVYPNAQLRTTRGAALAVYESCLTGAAGAVAA